MEGWEGGGGSGLAARLMGNAGLTAGLVLPKERGTNLPQARFFANDNISRGIFLCFTSGQPRWSCLCETEVIKSPAKVLLSVYATRHPIPEGTKWRQHEAE